MTLREREPSLCEGLLSYLLWLTAAAVFKTVRFYFYLFIFLKSKNLSRGWRVAYISSCQRMSSFLMTAIFSITQCRHQIHEKQQLNRSASHKQKRWTVTSSLHKLHAEDFYSVRGFLHTCDCTENSSRLPQNHNAWQYVKTSKWLFVPGPMFSQSADAHRDVDGIQRLTEAIRQQNKLLPKYLHETEN